MIRINLLPWREEQRQNAKREFFVFLGFAAGLAVLIVISMHLYVGGKISYQNKRIAYLTQEVNQIASKNGKLKSIKVERKRLLDQIQVIYNLQNSRYQVVRLLDELVRIMPKEIQLTKVQRKGSEIVISGQSPKNTIITQFMREIKKSKWLANPVLKEIKAGVGSQKRVRQFELQVVLAGGKLADIWGDS